MGKAFGCGCNTLVEKVRKKQKELQHVLSLNMDDSELCANKRIDFFLVTMDLIKNDWARCNCEVGVALNEILYVLEISSERFKSRDISQEDVENIYYVLVDNLWDQIT